MADVVDFRAEEEVPNLFWRRVYPDFTPEEFACPCCGAEEISYYLVAGLQNLRYALGKPIIINSGYRCSKHNKKVGGVEDSYHTRGLAADVSIENFNAQDKYVLVDFVFDSFFGVGIYPTHIHLDIRPCGVPAFWLSSK